MSAKITTQDREKAWRIGIVGGGFSGVALAATLRRLADQPVEIYLFEKTGAFAEGEAYGTPFSYHLLNVRAKDMSAFEDNPNHFVDWIKANAAAQALLEPDAAIGEQFVPRVLYHQYLKEMLAALQSDQQEKVSVKLEPVEVIDINVSEEGAMLKLHDQRQVTVDQVVLALGNHAPNRFPFPVSPEVQRIPNPWDYTALNAIEKDAAVMIVGTGLSMVDAVLTLYHQQHQGPIYAVSRHGLLPLPHIENALPIELLLTQLPSNVLSLSKYMRAKAKAHSEAGGDWRDVVNALRHHLPAVWGKASVSSKKRFLRHMLSYWNIHRHRIHAKLAALLEELQVAQQLQIIKGRVHHIENKTAYIQLRHTHQLKPVEIDWIINCMGPPMSITALQQPLVQSLFARGLAVADELNMGFAVSPVGELKNSAGNYSAILHTLGPTVKGTFWECSAVPDIRKQILSLVKHLIKGIEHETQNRASISGRE